MSRPSITVVLATYNGARYLDEQLASLWAQTCQDFHLLIRDDGSTDDTPRLIKQASEQHPGRITVLEKDGCRLGPAKSFACLLERCTTSYVAFCDQDDVWKPNKLARLVSEIRRLEGADAQVPSLVCSDVEVVDEHLGPLSTSYFRRHGFSVNDGRDLKLGRLIFRNYAIGATTMINRALQSACGELPPAAIMHDWWLALLACCVGKTHVIDEPLMLYRQHGANAVGSRSKRAPRSWAQFRHYIEHSRASVLRCTRQAAAMVDRHRASLSPRNRTTLEAFVDFEKHAVGRRWLSVVSNGAFKPGLMLNMLHLYACGTVRSSRSH